MGIIIIFLAILLVIFAYLKINSAYKYWENRGIPFIKPWLIFGNTAPFLFGKVSLAEFVENIYKQHSDKRYVGLYQFLEPSVMINDLELIKQITVKDFDSFPEHRTFLPENVDRLWDKNLFGMKGGQNWHDMRSRISPSFTTNKLKIMFGLIHNCAKQVTDYFQEQCGNNNSIAVAEMRDTFTRYGSDVIGTTALGVTTNSLKDKENLFYTMGKAVTDFTGLKRFVFFLSSISPKIMKIFNITVFDKKASDFFRGVIDETVKIREEKGIVRPDMIHLLMEAQKSSSDNENQNIDDSVFTSVLENSEVTRKPSKLKITNEDITAQALIFFSAGFDTSATLMSYVCYELALNPDVQERLFEEISETLAKSEGEITYEILLAMKYLDMVISETLRKWPSAEVTDRQVVKRYTIEPKYPNEAPLHLEPNMNVSIPMFAIHRDPKYYPNPEKFDPERFSDENKKHIKPFSYLPFGAGPRICIGSRFALLESKIVIFELLRKFEIIPVEKTQIPLVLSKGSFSLITENGIWLGFKLRNQ